MASKTPHYMTPRTPRTPRARSKSVGRQSPSRQRTPKTQKNQKRQKSPTSTDGPPGKLRPGRQSLARRLGPLHSTAPSESVRFHQLDEQRKARREMHAARRDQQEPATLFIGGINVFQDPDPLKSWVKVKEILNGICTPASIKKNPIKVSVFKPDDSSDDER